MRYWNNNIARGYDRESLPRVITRRNKHAILSLLKNLRATAAKFSDDVDAMLTELLASGEIVDSKNVPCSVVTIGSQVSIVDEAARGSFSASLVLSRNGNGPDKLSILTHLGVSLLGRRVGDEFTYRTSTSITRIKIVKMLYQPEAFGLYNAQG